MGDNGTCAFNMIKQTRFAMEATDISMTQESFHVKITNEDNAHNFL
jgi:hypothetical protein